ncbi:hypothetical protein [Legionella sp.]|uniref:hypothetical protein n=1 Tax=Legionella sp. TaxID=459 RepID=UPI0032207248
MTEINYQKWAKIDLLELWQGIYLLLGEEPNTAEFLFDRPTIHREAIFMRQFEDIADQACASIKRGTLKTHIYRKELLRCEIVPEIFFTWAMNKGFQFDDSFLHLVQSTDQTLSDDKVSSNAKRQQRSHGLRELIKEIFYKNQSISNKEMWKKLQQKANDSDLIQEVTSWSAHNAHIAWISQYGSERRMEKKTFITFMSVLRRNNSRLISHSPS